MPRLSQEEIVSIRVMDIKEVSRRGIARTMRVSEGAVRYHLRKAAEGRSGEDGRRGKERAAAPWADPIREWMEMYGEDGRPPNVSDLHEWLVAEHGYAGSYKSVLRHVRAEWPPPARRTYRRVETPPGVQAQADWVERRAVIGGLEKAVYGFWLVLSHSRAEAAVWRETMDQLSWQEAHNEAFRRLGGVPAVVRIDNLKTGMAAAGPQGRVNPVYRRYAEAAGFLVDPCPVRHPEAKGKVERSIGGRADRVLAARRGGFADLEDLQGHSDGELERGMARRICPATGTSVAEALAAERELLRPPDALPAVFDTVATRTAGKDCTVCFEGRTYSVPFHLAWERVEIRGGPGTVAVWHGGREVARHPRGTAERVLLDPAHFEGPATSTHLPPLPLGRLAREIAELAEAPVQLRAAEWYGRLVEAAG